MNAKPCECCLKTIDFTLKRKNLVKGTDPREQTINIQIMNMKIHLHTCAGIQELLSQQNSYYRVKFICTNIVSFIS